MLKALFAVWANKKCVMSADLFYQKMTTFGLVPDLKFIEGITTIVYSNRPKMLNQPTSQNQNHSHNKTTMSKKRNSLENTIADSQSNVS